MPDITILMRSQHIRLRWEMTALARRASIFRKDRRIDQSSMETTVDLAIPLRIMAIFFAYAG